MENYSLGKEQKVLIISYDMIPTASSWGSSQRMFFLSEFLNKMNFSVTVYSCAKNSNNYYGNIVNFKNISVPIKNKIINKNLFSHIKTLGINSNKNSNYPPEELITISRFSKIREKIRKLAKKVDKFIFNEPTFMMSIKSRVWINENKNCILSYIKSNEIKNIIITAPPFGMFAMAGYIKRYCPSVNLILDYRDPWNLWSKQSFYALQLEKKYMKYADIITCTNENIAKDLSKCYNINNDKIKVISNGYSAKLWEKCNFKEEQRNFFCITYAGDISFEPSSLSGFRDTSKLLVAFDRCLIENMNIRLRFVGVDESKDSYTAILKEKYREKIEFCGKVDAQRSYEYMVNSDVLMLLHTISDKSSQYIVSGKMYDYIKARKMILSIGDKNGLHADIINKYQIGVHCENDIDEIFNAIRCLYQKWNDNTLEPPKIEFDVHSREYQNKKYMDLLL